MKSRKKHKRRQRRQHAMLKRGGFTLLDTLMCSPDQPTRPERKTQMLLDMYVALDAIKSGQQPDITHWRALADAVNLCQGLVELGHASDEGGVINQAVMCMADAARRYEKTKAIRLSGEGITAVQSALASWEDALNSLPERTILLTKQHTVRRIYDAVQNGGDDSVQIVDVTA